MSSPPNRQWIVILHRDPKGPLSTEDVRTLMNERIFSPNDLACSVDQEEGGLKSSGWKFLWQFPEFNRRKPKTEKEKLELAEERRKEASEVTVEKTLQEKLDTVLSPEILDIDVTDLVLNPRQAQLRADSLSDLSPNQRSSENGAQLTGLSLGRTAGLLGLAFVLVALLAYKLMPGEDSKDSKQTTRAITGTSSGKTTTPKITARPLQMPKKSAVTSMPKAPEPSPAPRREEATHDEIRSPEEDDRFAEEQEDEQEDRARKKRAKKKRAAAREDREMSSEDSENEDRGEILLPEDRPSRKEPRADEDDLAEQED